MFSFLILLRILILTEIFEFLAFKSAFNNLFNKITDMDFKKLSDLIPKHPNSWSVEDVSVWLNFIGLAQY